MLTKLKKLHGDESGLKTLEVVAILAIAAIILAVIKTFWTTIKAWFTKETENIDTGWGSENEGGGTAPAGP